MRLWEYKRGSNLALEPVDMVRGPPTLWLGDGKGRGKNNQLVLFVYNSHYS